MSTKDDDEFMLDIEDWMEEEERKEHPPTGIPSIAMFISVSRWLWHCLGVLSNTAKPPRMSIQTTCGLPEAGL
jgi:hypothetical protein